MWKVEERKEEMPAPMTLPPLDEQLQSELHQRYEEAGDAETRTRYQMIVLAQAGHTAPPIARLVLRSADTVELDEITGSIGLTGAVDGALILKCERGQHEATLFVTGRDIEQEQQVALRFDPFTAMWMQVGNAEEVKRTRERQEILNLLSEQLPEGMSARQVAEALDKNYHATRCLLRKLEAAGEIIHINNHYVATAGENSRNHSHHCNQRHQTEQSAQHMIGQIEYGEESCLPSRDYPRDAQRGFITEQCVRTFLTTAPA